MTARRWRQLCALCALMASVVTMPAQAGASCRVVAIPSLFVSQRVFAIALAAADRRTLRFWVDTDGSGFIFDDVARRYGTLMSDTGTPARAELPRLAASADVPSLTTHAGTLSVLRRADVVQDPIFAGLSGQLGASWLQGRVWTFDYSRGELLWRCDGSEPDHAKSQEIPLSFARDANGHLIGGAEYPQLKVAIEGRRLLASLDTAATVALSKRDVEVLQGLQAVRATSFATRALVTQWHEQHPSWRYIKNAGQQAGIDAIRVPEVSAGAVQFHDVWFTTRPDDDVFEGEREQLKLGPTAFGCCVLTVDYRRRRAILQGWGFTAGGSSSLLQPALDRRRACRHRFELPTTGFIGDRRTAGGADRRAGW